MEVCHDYKIPHSEFLSWSRADRDKAIWMHIRKAQTCSGCGTRAEEWDPAHGGHHGAYLAVQTICPGCQQIQARQEHASKEHQKVPHGLKTQLKPNDQVNRR